MQFVNTLHRIAWTVAYYFALLTMKRTTSVTATKTPVIGVLSQPRLDPGKGNHSSSTEEVYYVAASYVKWLEAGGARSIPIPYDIHLNLTLLDELFGQINALFLPGGAAEMPSGLTMLLDKIVESNQAGNYFSVWGTCLGFEFLLEYVAGGPGPALEAGFDSHNTSLALQSVLPLGLYHDPAMYAIATQLPVTLNNHNMGISPEHFFADELLSEFWMATSVNEDANGRSFVSTIEPIDQDAFPIYGVQYHPEKNAFEYSPYPGTDIPYEAINHSSEGIAFSLYLADYFVDLARRSVETNLEHAYNQSALYPLISTYPVLAGVKFEQIYLVPSSSYWKNNNNHQREHALMEWEIHTRTG